MSPEEGYATWGIVVAAGRGKRFGGPKHAAELGGRPVWEWARSALLDGGAEQVVVVGPVPEGVPGGERRRDSVWAGLSRVPTFVPFVLVHDAARPLASAELARRVIERLRAGDAEGVVPAIPVRDALKRIEGERVTATIERGGVMGAQTPQGFIADALRRAHIGVPGDVPDDAALVERAGLRVVAIAGEPDNHKITFRSDLRMARALLDERQRAEVAGPMDSP